MIRLGDLPSPPAELSGWPWTAEGHQLPANMPDGRSWPRISIITPSFNQVSFIEATIRSVLLQGYPNLEYIIIDGGSTDGSLEIIRKYEPWVSYWQSRPDGGQYHAVQNGFERSSGEVMAWLNSDDMYFPWTFRTIVEAFMTIPDLRWLSTSSICTIGPQNNSLFDIQRVSAFSRRSFFSQNIRRRPVFIQQEATFWRRDLWDQAGARLADDLNYAGDFELWTRFWKYEELATTPTPLALFRRHQHQKTSNLNAYLNEVEIILKKSRRTFPLPLFAVLPFIFLCYPFDPARNWLGARKRIVQLDNQKNQWLEKFSYIEDPKLFLFTL